MKSKLPITRPFLPMEAKSVEEIPTGSNWQYEPKWDGFQCVAFREGSSVELQSKSAQSLTRYFPELVAALGKLKPDKFVLDGELIVLVNEKLSFDDLLQRIHPAASRVAKLAVQTPAKFVLFDLLVDAKGRSLIGETLAQRRTKLETFAAEYLRGNSTFLLSPATADIKVARQWLKTMRGQLDGLIAKPLDAPYSPGERAMQKIKNLRTVDCVVAGFRYGTKTQTLSLTANNIFDVNARRATSELKDYAPLAGRDIRLTARLGF